MASWNISVGDGDLKADGTVPMSADWTFGDQDLVDIKQLAVGHSTPEAALDVRDAGAAIDPAAVISGTVGMLVAGGTDAADCRLALIAGGGAGSISAIDFGDPADQDAGCILYDHATDILTMCAGAGAIGFTLHPTGRVVIGSTGSANSPLHLVGGVSGAVQVLTIEQFDIDDSFINFKGTSAADSTRSISSSTAEAAAKTGAILCELNGATFWLRGYASAV